MPNKAPFRLTRPMLKKGLVFLGCLLLILGNFFPWRSTAYACVKYVRGGVF